MAGHPRVVIGVPLYNRADYLPEALDSLLAQTYRDFALLLLDDGSTDATPEIVRTYASGDRRIVRIRNEIRLGMVRSWRKAFSLASELYPDAEYFAWASDHDVWHPRWLSAMITELDRYPEVVLAYPLNRRISESGAVVREPWTFDTFGVAEASRRLWRVCWDMRGGDMVYGLFRSRTLRQADGFRSVLLPDRLLLAEAALCGQFKQVPEVLWHRRFSGLFSFDRQRASIFLNRLPLQSRLPWWLTHAVVLAWHLGIRGRGRPGFGRLAGLWYALISLPVNASRSVNGAWRAQRRGLLRRLPLTRKQLRRVVESRRKRLRGAVRRLRRDRCRRPIRTVDSALKRGRRSLDRQRWWRRSRGMRRGLIRFGARHCRRLVRRARARIRPAHC